MNHFLTWLRRTSTFFCLCPRRAEWGYVPSYAGDAPDAGDVVSSKGRFSCPALSAPPPAAGGTTPAAPLPAFRFPGDCGKGGGRGRRSPSLSFSSGRWRSSWAPLELVLRRSFSLSQLLSWRSCLSRSVLIFGEGEVAVWGKSLRPSQGSPVCTVESTLVCRFFFSGQ